MKSVNLANTFCGPYILDARISEDEDFEIYSAHHSENYHKAYRAKVTKPGVDPKRAPDLQLEFNTLKQLTCTGIPNAYKLGTARDLPCLITDLIEGESLGQMVNAKVEFDHLAAYITATKLIAFLHERNILHNHINPESFTLRKSDQRLYLTDFNRLGSWKKKGILSGLLSGKKKTGGLDPQTLVAGYSAPELFAGESPTPKSDVYSLGELGHFLLGQKDEADVGADKKPNSSGRNRTTQGRGFQGPGSRFSGPSSRTQAALHREYGQINPRLVELIECCLRSNLDFRPENAVRLLADLRPFFEEHVKGG